MAKKRLSQIKKNQVSVNPKKNGGLMTAVFK